MRMQSIRICEICGHAWGGRPDDDCPMCNEWKSIDIY
jgi:rubrerythrin